MLQIKLGPGLVMLLALLACSASVTPTTQPTPAPSFTPIPTLAPTASSAPTATPTVAPTPTPVPPPTFTPTPRPTTTPTPEPTLTPTPTPSPTPTPVPPEPITVLIAPTKDNTLYQDSSGGRSNGAGQHVFVGNTTSGSLRRGIMAFDISNSIPTGATITGVTLTLRLSRTINDTQTITLHRMLADWGEGTDEGLGNEGSGAPASTGAATWLHRFFDADIWELPGGDFSERVSASRPVSQPGRYTWGSTPEMVEDVQGWLDNPSQNFGWLLKGNEEDRRSTKRFDSRQNEDLENRPRLTVEYLSPVGPETTREAP